MRHGTPMKTPSKVTPSQIDDQVLMTPSFSPNQSHRIVGHWLLFMAGMVFFTIVLGGLTRLTYSGLSMVDWRPVTGWLPPLTLEEWNAVFSAYRQSPEYLKINAGMTLEDFKSIFWLEYIHRLWGRLIGLVFLLPFLFFSFKGLIPKGRRLSVFTLFILGGLQGVLGWYMVKSGLVDDPNVSQYRLMAHLGLAFVIIGALIATSRSFYVPSSEKTAGCKIFATLILGCVFITILAGALVAGLKAGLTYNSFPLMDGELIPQGMYAQTPVWLNLFENITTVQFNHRLLAMISVGVILIYVLTSSRRNRVMYLLLCAALLQAILGILTLLMHVPVPLAALHQAGGVVLFSITVWHFYDVIHQR